MRLAFCFFVTVVWAQKTKDTKSKMAINGEIMKERIYEKKMKEKWTKMAGAIKDAVEVVDGMKKTQAQDQKMIEDRQEADLLAAKGVTGRKRARARRDAQMLKKPNFVKCIGSPLDTDVKINGESKTLMEVLEEHDMIRGIKSLNQCQAECSRMGAHKFSIECPRQNHYSLPVGLCVCLDDDMPVHQVPTKTCMPKVSDDPLCNSRSSNYHMDRLNIMYSLGGSHAGALYRIEENEPKNNVI